MGGYISRMIIDRGFGFIREGTRQQPGEKEWFFHRRECDPLSPFNQLRQFDMVQFDDEEENEKGFRAIGVRLA